MIFQVFPQMKTPSLLKWTILWMILINQLSVLISIQQFKEFFIKFNTPIPSSTPVERLFSQAALVLTIRKNQLSD